ncbi:AAA family ATPase [Micromonospora sp. NPDC047465]|uniref:ATP-binding protein n=1 Tax=Micromonospora sp. NPDC047465 TaxID=3154813 RepID=UPI0033FA194F
MDQRAGRRDGRALHVARPPFVERDGVLESLVSAVDQPTLVLLSGEAGLGKSRLIAELDGSTRVLVGRCHRLRDPFPLGPFVHVLRTLSARGGLRDLPAPAGALRLLVPELAHSLPALPDGAHDPRVLRHLMFRGIEAALRGAAPTVLVIEDAHWIDEQTLEFLEFLVSDPLPGLSVVVTFRDGEVDPAVPALATRAGESMSVSRIPLSRWDVSGCGQLAAAMLGLTTVTPEFAEHLWQRSSGLPLAIRELLRLLVERGTIAMHDGDWVRRSIDELEVPAGIRDPVLERVSRLTPEAQALVEGAAVLQGPVDREVLSAVSGIRGQALTCGLLKAETSGLLVEHEGTYEVSHVLAAEAVYSGLATVRREALHGRAALALRSARPCPLARVAHHEREAGVPGWPDTAEAAADQALAVGDDAGVVAALEPVLLEASVPREQRARVLLTLSRAAIYTLRGIRLLKVFEAEVARDDGCLTPDIRVRVASNASQLANNHLCDAAPGGALGSLARLEGVSDSAGLTAELMAITRWLPGRSTAGIGDALTDIERRIRVAALDDDRRQQLDMMVDEVRLFAGVADPVRLAKRAFGPPDSRTMFVGHTSLAEVAVATGDLRFAVRLLDLCDDVDDPRIVPFTLRGRGVTIRLLVDFFRGKWSNLMGPTGVPRRSSGPEPSDRLVEDACLAALSLAVKGPTAAAVEQLDRVLTVTAAGSQHTVLALALTPRVRAARATPERGHVPGVDRFLAAVPDRAIIPCLYRALPAVTTLLLADRERERAQRMVAAFATRAEHIHAPLAPASLGYARGLLLLDRDPGSQEAMELLCAAANQYDLIPMPYEAAHVRETAARALAGHDPSRAEHLMAAAIRTFQDLGASWDLGRTRHTARANGWSVPGLARVGRPAYGNSLSPRERDVAELAAQGLTNEEIAQRLYVSVHTVRKHVAAALRKLGVDSRRRLAQRLAATADA